MARHIMLLAVALLLALVISVTAQEKTIKKTPITYTSPASGQEMYNHYCAVCHGKDGKGNGPAASALKDPVTDLTTLAKRNQGEFPALRVAAVLRGQAQIGAHGTAEMPIWGPLFWRMSGGSGAEVQQRIANLSKYMESMQVK
jgi:mono/diheme cytochrome c family protein